MLIGKELKEYTFTINGKKVICTIPDCKCNVFTKIDNKENTYICSGCKTEYIIE